jgi:hypothetical protein
MCWIGRGGSARRWRLTSEELAGRVVVAAEAFLKAAES